MSGKKDGRDKLVEQYHDLNKQIPKAQIKKKINEIATRRKHTDGYGSSRWVINSEVAETLGVEGIDSITFTPPKPTKEKKEKKEKPVTDK